VLRTNCVTRFFSPYTLRNFSVKFFATRCKHLGHHAGKGKFCYEVNLCYLGYFRTPSNFRFFEYVGGWVGGWVGEWVSE
jgi:hypothetical protein